ncbi:hypothetical protein FBBAL38_09279 [Flavobacteria bacterium BAL38]|uniref:hypothetical protein n=1 Tax=unclassified Flavobacterium TaxID=196869 RepID=UPI0000F39290|nr:MULTISPECIES: hypothetical protein [unclassified Flavobacterium]EAZ95169.1 hypothetical protein FBBAL38_09279 [Flavobacteria bacterium BAL38]MQP53524.1 hypothetical protein [Flavobacterium sp. LMO9]MQP63527.1 hypothetical protein [Flavobacterium sp. LMO6]
MSKIKILLIFLFILTVSLVYFCFNPIVIDNRNYNISYINQYLVFEENVKILKNIDFSKKEIKAILLIKDDINLSNKIKKGKVLVTNDIEIIKQIKNNWNFTKTNGDISTVENELFIYENEKLILRTFIVLDDSVDSNINGIQNTELGWLSSNYDIIEQCSKFKRVYFPIILL